MLLGDKQYIIQQLRLCVRAAIVRFWNLTEDNSGFADEVMASMSDAPLISIITERQYSDVSIIRGRHNYAVVSSQMAEEFSCALAAVRPTFFWSDKRTKKLKTLLISEFGRFDRGRRYGRDDDNSSES